MFKPTLQFLISQSCIITVRTLRNHQCIHLFFWLKFPPSARRQRGQGRLPPAPSSRHGTQVHFVQAVRGFLNSFLLPGCSYIPSLLITARSYAPAIPKVLGDPQSTGSGHPRRSAFLGHYQTWQLKVGAFQPSFKLPWSWQPAVSLQIVDEPEEFARLLLCHHLKETRTHR